MEVGAIRLETKRTLELVKFVEACEIAPLSYDGPHYVLTDDLAEDACRVIRDALRKSEKVGLGQLTMRGREYLCAVRPCGDGLLLQTQHYADEIGQTDPLFSSIEDETADEDLLSVAEELISGRRNPSTPKRSRTVAMRPCAT